MIKDNLKPLLKLWLIPNVGLKNIQRILKICADASEIAEVFKLSSTGLQSKYHLPAKIAQIIANHKSDKELSREIALLAKHKVNVISFFDAEYPGSLRQIYCPPPLLYFKGSLNTDYSRSISIVGTRNSSFYGVNNTRKIIARLKELDDKLAIISGLALGIDSVSHAEALKQDLKTIAVLGNGLASIYPQQNAKLAAQILAQGGAIISEAPMTTSPLPHIFPLRNRIISGLSPVLLVMEASTKSGSLITARYALEQNRDVFALPGPLGMESYSGSLNLIKKGVAALLTSAEDVVENLNTRFQRRLQQSTSKVVPKSTANTTKTKASKKTTSPTFNDHTQQTVYDYLLKGPASLELLCDELNLENSVVLSILSQFELKGLLFTNTEGLYQISDKTPYVP